MSPYPISITQLRLLSSFNGFAVNITDCLTIHSDEIFYAYDDKALKYSVCTNSIPSELLLIKNILQSKMTARKILFFGVLMVNLSQKVKCKNVIVLYLMKILFA